MLNDTLSFPLVHPVVKKVSFQKSLYQNYEDEIEKIWKKECEKRSSNLFFNGHVANLISYSREILEIEFIEYKLLYAWTHSFFLRTEIKLYPVGIQVITECDDYFLCGKRSLQVALYPGIWEPVPSGCIDIESCNENGEIDLKKLAIKELYEEACISPTYPFQFEVEKLLWSKKDGLWDILCRLTLSEEDMKKNAQKSDEYSEIIWRKKF